MSGGGCDFFFFFFLGGGVHFKTKEEADFFYTSIFKLFLTTPNKDIYARFGYIFCTYHAYCRVFFHGHKGGGTIPRLVLNSRSESIVPYSKINVHLQQDITIN